MPESAKRPRLEELELQELLAYKTLKMLHRTERHGYPEALSLRVHRALSWLQRSEQEKVDSDARFLFLWISFNAAYARELDERRGFSERRLLFRYVNRLIKADNQSLIYHAVWHSYSESIRLLLDNEFVFQPYWDYQNGRISEDRWRDSFRLSKVAVVKALGRMDTKKVLAIVIDRLYTLRNQLVHGGSTWNSSVNRKQVKEGASILGLLVPLLIYLMMRSPDQPWGEPCYPVVQG